MNVSGSDFPGQLATILERISKARFIAFDLELSGIPVRGDGKSSRTIAARYKELKAAAEKYHILQVGITCIEENVKEKAYTTYAYNFNLNPLVDERLGLNRDFTYSSSAVDFLIHNGYQMHAPFINAVPYLNRQERESVFERTQRKMDKKNYGSMNIRKDDTETHTFLDRVKRQISEWSRTRSPHRDFIHIWDDPRPDSTENTPLSPFRRRLIHELVRNDFPEFQTNSENYGVKVKDVNPVEQQRNREDLIARVNETIFANTGFGWIAEALAQGDLAGLGLRGMHEKSERSGHKIGKEVYADAKEYSVRVKEIVAELKKKQTIIVGHNCFLDLVYLFSTFYGPLPDTIEEFVAKVHGVFPTIIDTKSIASLGDEFAHGRNSQLFQLNEVADNIKNPVVVDGSVDDQPQVPAYHEAGYDSFSTARVFLKLAGLLLTDGKIYVPTPQQDESPLDAKFENLAVSGKPVSDEAEISPKDESAWSQLSKNKRKKLLREGVSREDYNAGRFSSPNGFSVLDDLPDEDSDEIAEKPTGSAAALPPEGGVYLRKPMPVPDPKKRFLLPAQDDTAFWSKFINRLRVGGTDEEELRMDDLTRRYTDPSTEIAAEPATEDAKLDKKVTEEGAADIEKDKKKKGLLGGLLEAIVKR